MTLPPNGGNRMDCSPEFIGCMTGAIYAGSFMRVRLVAPLLYMTKAEVVTLGYHHHAPLELTWSCYQGGEYHCGTCPTCIERHQAFIAGIGMDPTQYLTKVVVP
jgi:7-cyano-7-deazaguanine synthase